MSVTISDITQVPWLREDAPFDDVVVSTRVRLSRNIHGYNFPWKMNRQDEEDLSADFINLWKNSSEKSEPQELQSIEMKLRGVLKECSFIDETHNLEPWKSLVINQHNDGVVLFNWIDHLRFLSLSGGLNPRSAWDKVLEMEKPVADKLDYVTDPELGYLSSNMYNSGTGLKISLLLHLPALGRRKDFDKILMSLEENGMSIRGFFGEGEESLGDLYQVSNMYTLGVTEVDTLKALTQVGEDLSALERKARNDWFESGAVRLKDKIFRSAGILSHSYLLKQNEAIRHIMNIRLGAALKIISIPLTKIDRWMYQIKDHHLSVIQHNEIKSMENRYIEECRAKFMREAMASAFYGGQNV